MKQHTIPEQAPKGKTKAEVLRFCITGATITAILYGIYYTMLEFDFSIDISFTVGFAVSFICNFVLTNYYTFRTRLDVDNALRFSLCQGINFVMQYVTLKLFVFLGMREEIAIVPVWVIIFPINFWLMRTLLRSDRFRLRKGGNTKPIQ